MKYKSSLRRQDVQSSHENNDKNSNQLSHSEVNDHITSEGLGIESQTVSKLVLLFQYFVNITIKYLIMNFE
jgi:hypothetical protein